MITVLVLQPGRKCLCWNNLQLLNFGFNLVLLRDFHVHSQYRHMKMLENLLVGRILFDIRIELFELSTLVTTLVVFFASSKTASNLP